MLCLLATPQLEHLLRRLPYPLGIDPSAPYGRYLARVNKMELTMYAH